MCRACLNLICVVGDPSPQHHEQQQKLHQAHAALQAALIATREQQQQEERQQQQQLEEQQVEEQEAALLQQPQQQQRQEEQTTPSANAIYISTSGTPFLSPPQVGLTLAQQDSAQANRTIQSPQHELSLTPNVSLVPQTLSGELRSQWNPPAIIPPAQLSASTGPNTKKTKDSASVQDCFIPPPELGPAPAASFTALSPSTLPPLLHQLLLHNKECCSTSSSCSIGNQAAGCYCDCNGNSSKPSCSSISSSRCDCWTDSGGDKGACVSANCLGGATCEQVVAGVLLLPVYSALRGAFPLLGTYFQVSKFTA